MEQAIIESAAMAHRMVTNLPPWNVWIAAGLVVAMWMAVFSGRPWKPESEEERRRGFW